MEIIKLRLIWYVILIILFVPLSVAYSVAPPNHTVHQHISKEAISIWSEIPAEIQNHGATPINQNMPGIISCDTCGYQAGDDIITASGEEDFYVTEAFE